MEQTKKVQTARCPKCNGIIMISIFPREVPHDEDGFREWMELLNIGCPINVEPFSNEKIIWHEKTKCDFNLET